MARGGSGGSQLAQLKSSVQSAGISDRRQQSTSSKKRKRGSHGSERDEAAARRQALARLEADNPFEQKVTKLKHDVLGRKVKGATGHPALAKQGGLAQRRATLLPEYQNRNRSGTFIDRRFGETDDSLTPEERMLERFTREKQRQAKGKKAALFNLNDDEGQEEELTHFGRSLSGMGNLPELSMIGDGEDDDRGINATSTAEDHFGGFEAESSDRSKSKADVMREVMAKSKMHKMERQQMRDADDELRAQLDDEIGDIRSLLMSSNIPPPTTEAAEATGPNPPMKERSAGNDYDGFVRELAFERRAKPQDRLKTEAELAEEEASQLRAAELARIRRMRGEPAAESEQDGSRKRSAPQGDDLADDFDIDGQTAAEVYGLGTGLGGEEADDNGAESESDEDEGSSDGEQDPALEADGYGSALEDESDDSADGEDGDESIAPTAKDSKSQQTNNKSRKGADAVPFTFECPVTHEAFLSILDEHSLRPSQVPLVVKRIRALHHPSLAEDNKFKLQGFAGVLLDHALYCASQAVRVSSRDERAELMALIDHLLKPIFELATTYPKAVAEAFVEKLALMERNLTKGLSKGATKPTSRTWPGAAELTLVRLAGLVWPTSDLNHVVTTPLALLEAHYLAHCRIRSYADLTSGLFLLTCFVQQQAGSEAAKRMMPEVLNFAHNAIILLSPLRTRSAKEGSKKICENFGIPTPDFGEAHAKHLALPNKVSDEASNPDLFQLLGSHSATDADEIEEHDTRKSLDLLNLVLALVPQLSLMYQGTAAFVELFEPIRLTLDVVRKTDSFTSFTALDQCYSTLNEQLDRARHLRRPLRLHAHRAIPLASFVPKFDEGGRRSRSGAAFDPDSARAETAKLKALLKKEKKGAVRELRRDAQFLAQHRAEEKRKEDEIYRRKMGKITAALGEERGEEKRLQKEKDRIKRKAGGSR